MAADSNAPPPTKQLEEIIETLRYHLPDLRRRYGLVSVGVFGSWVRGDIHPDSDVDLLVELEDPSLSLLQFVALQNELSALLGARVDLVEKKVLKPSIGQRILDEVVYV